MATSTKRDKLTLTTTDFQEVEAQAAQQGELIVKTTEFGVQVNLPQILGEGGDRTFQLRHGLEITVRSGKLWRTLRCESPHDLLMPLVAKFYLSGASRVLTPNVPDINPDYRETVGHHYLYYLPDLVEFEEWRGQEPFQVIMIQLQPIALHSFLKAGEALPEPLQQAIEGNVGHRFHQAIGKITPSMTQILHHILGCPYQGMMRRMYLESKALELLTLQLMQWMEGNATPQWWIRLRPDDIERLHQAKDILIQRMETPPSLLELARQVGIDDCKLKRGFRQLFGVTVFGYLHQARLERSRQLLATGTMSVTEVAYTVGYSSLPSFSKAFRKRFGSSPLAYASALHMG